MVDADYPRRSGLVEYVIFMQTAIGYLLDLGGPVLREIEKKHILFFLVWEMDTR